jgi:hypothetical protein
VGLVLGIDPDTVVADRIPSISRETDFDEPSPPAEAEAEPPPFRDSVPFRHSVPFKDSVPH